ncbi:MAG: hypothetical protein HY894_08510 [Deltaproteobacteria bacterium]|nr:hypothetical protein [Deltaproteobacteria bacterium]
MEYRTVKAIEGPLVFAGRISGAGPWRYVRGQARQGRPASIDHIGRHTR